MQRLQKQTRSQEWAGRERPNATGEMKANLGPWAILLETANEALVRNLVSTALRGGIVWV